MKTISESKAVLTQWMSVIHANPAGNVHGGEIMKMMDNCAGIAAMRHAHGNVVTVRVDELIFHQPVHLGELVTCEAELVYAGRTSMEVKVAVKVEDVMQENKRTAITAFFTFVAIDEAGKPRAVQELLPETEDEKKAFEEGRQRYTLHKTHK